MPTAYEDQFFTVDPGSPPASGTSLIFQRVEFIDEDSNGSIATGAGDTFNGVTVDQVWQNDTVTVNVPGVGNITYTGVTFYLTSGSPVFTPTDGQVLQNGTFVSSTFVSTATETPVGNFGPTCFTPGTWIDTPTGRCLVEDLQVGDLVTTLDDGPQPIKLIVDDIFRAVGNVAPIRFATGAIGNKAPLIVSPQHRMLISGWQAELNFGQPEMLIAAKHMVNHDTIRVLEGGTVRYIHLLFDAHQIVFGQGVPSESYFPGHALNEAEDATRSELQHLFPHVTDQVDKIWQSVRPVLKRREMVLIGC